MKNLSRAVTIFLLGWWVGCSLVLPIQAANPLEVVINEIAWMGTRVSYNDEWLELYNNTDSAINLEGWILEAADGTPEITLTETILAKGFYLLERTNDDTVPGISADQIYTGALENDGENLKLYDNLGNLIDKVDCSSGWFTGDNSTKQTMERVNPQLSGSYPNNWAPSQNPSGTPKIKNSVISQIKPSPEEQAGEPELESQPTEEPMEAKKPIIPHQSELGAGQAYPSGLVINEILPSPTGPDEEEEWVEIFNQNEFEVDLSEWQITDTAGRAKTYTLSKGTKISPQGFLVLFRPTTKITLNNSGDGLKLLQPDENIIDSVTYEKAPRGQSYNRTEFGWMWSTTLTPGSANIIPITPEETSEEKPEAKLQTKKELAAIGEQVPKSSKSFFIVLIAFGIAIFSGIIILILKRKIKPEQLL